MKNRLNKEERIDWLLKGEASIQYQTQRDLLGLKNKDLQDRIQGEGWGKRLLSLRKGNGHWGDHFYQPKWISTHYTLLDLRNLNLSPTNEAVQSSIASVLKSNQAEDGGIRLGPSTAQRSDVCVNGMFLNYASYFQTEEDKMSGLVDALLHEWMPDGGFNCRSTRSGAHHSSLHSTISVLEGFHSFLTQGHMYRLDEILQAKESAEEFILIHRLFKSDKTGQLIHPEFLKMPYPWRWKYNILRSMNYFYMTKKPWDNRMTDAVEQILSKRKQNGLWTVQAAHPGQVHFTMEKAGSASRWNTLFAMRLLDFYNIDCD